MVLPTILLKSLRYVRYLLHRYIKSRYFSRYKLYLDVDIKCVSKRKEFYFGYYNNSPENTVGDLVYCDLEKDSNGEISVILNRSGEEIVIGHTSAYNLQQGCMLQWGYTNNKLIYYNRYNKKSNMYECVVFDSEKMQQKDILSIPIYSLSKQEDYALSLNFERLAEMRPDYGYFCRRDYTMPDNSQDGIWKIDIITKQVSLLVTLQDLIDMNPVSSMDGARHKVNHIDISPDGTRFMFLHRWVGPQGRFMRLITADKDGNSMYILNGDKMTSHCCWNGKNKIISYCNTEEYGDTYVEFIDMSCQKQKVSDKLPLYDGHPTVSPNAQWIVTDCYPKLDRFSELYLYHIKTDTNYCVGHFYQPLKYFRTSRVDLHPKWSMTGDKVYFESGHSGNRRLYNIDIKRI